MYDEGGTLGTPSSPAAMNRSNADTTLGSREGAITRADGPRLWTPREGLSGLVVVARLPPLLAVVGGHIVQMAGNGSSNSEDNETHTAFRGRLQPVTLGGLVIVSNSRQKEPTRVIGHPDLASGASVQRGEVLYVSVAEAIYRETRGEDVELHLVPTDEDNEALLDLRARARHRWESDRLPDGWTRPLPANPTPTPTPSKQHPLDGGLPDDLRELAERIRAKEADAGSSPA